MHPCVVNPTSGLQKALIYAPSGHPAYRCRISFTAAPHAVRHMRRVVRAYLRLWKMFDLAGAAELALTELVTNVIRHVPDRRCTLVVLRQSNGVRVEVHDSSPVMPVMRPAGMLEESGRGLPTVALITDAWGADPAARGGGKIVWFQLVMNP